jgi:hypothetical protein
VKRYEQHTDGLYLTPELDFLERETASAGCFVAELRCGPTAYCFVTWMLFALVVSVNPVVCLVNDPCWLGERSRADIKRRQ